MDHLLRTMASISPEARVLSLGDETGQATAQLARLGFDLWASSPAPDVVREALTGVLSRDESDRRVSADPLDTLPYPDASFDWVAAFLSAQASGETFSEIQRVLKRGSWVWVSMLEADPDTLNDLARGVGLAIAEPVVSQDVDGVSGALGIFRRVDGDVTG